MGEASHNATLRRMEDAAAYDQANVTTDLTRVGWSKPTPLLPSTDGGVPLATIEHVQECARIR